ncbi:MAG TPA: fumarate reductase subunit FrdD [Natronosporangium sp.]
MKGPKPSVEPFVWLGFSAGGMVSALLVPVLLFLFGVAIPLGWLESPEYDHVLAVARHPLTRLVLLGLCVLSLIHFAHRFRFTLIDGLQLRRYDGVIALGTYGLAAVGSVLAGWVLLFMV